MHSVKILFLSGLAAAIIAVPTLARASVAKAATNSPTATSTCAAALDIVSDLKSGAKTEALQDLTALLPGGGVQAVIAELLSGNTLGALVLLETLVPTQSDVLEDVLTGDIFGAVEDLLGLLPSGAVETAITDILSGHIGAAKALLLTLC